MELAPLRMRNGHCFQTCCETKTTNAYAHVYTRVHTFIALPKRRKAFTSPKQFSAIMPMRSTSHINTHTHTWIHCHRQFQMLNTSALVKKQEQWKGKKKLTESNKLKSLIPNVAFQLGQCQSPVCAFVRSFSECRPTLAHTVTCHSSNTHMYPSKYICT